MVFGGFSRRCCSSGPYLSEEGVRTVLACARLLGTDQPLGTAIFCSEVKHAAIPDTCSQNTESSDILTVKQGMLIQHLEEKVSEMKQKLKRMDQVIRQLEFDYQETLTMLSVAKDFFSCFVPTEAAANAAISFFFRKR